MSKKDDLEIYTVPSSPEEDERLSHQALELYGGPAFIEPHVENGTRVLDVGCGTGVITQHLAKNFPETRFVGVDLDETRIEENKHHNKLENVEYICSGASALPFQDHTFDLVHCRFLLFHLIDPVQAVREMIRVLKPNGKIVACEVLHEVWTWPIKPTFQKFLESWRKTMTSHGQDPMIGIRLNDIFKQAGAKNIELKIRTDSYLGDTKLFAEYMQNWSKIADSVRSSLNEKMPDEEFSKIREELFKPEPNGYFLELTPTVTGYKSLD